MRLAICPTCTRSFDSDEKIPNYNYHTGKVYDTSAVQYRITCPVCSVPLIQYFAQSEKQGMISE
jgi:hypothetical protein